MDKARSETDKLLAQLEKKISSTYAEASEEMEATVNEYFNNFRARDAQQLELLKQGKISKQQYDQWRLNQIGRGDRMETMRTALAERYVEADVIANGYVNDAMAGVYALNRMYTINDVAGVNYVMYDEATVKRLLVNNPDLMPNYPEAKAVARGIDLAYGKTQIRESITSGILQGKSIDKIATDMQNRMEDMSRASAIRTARTAFTEAENAGRLDGTQELEDMGCIMKREWLATNDDRTREEHAEADGQQVDVDEPFIVGGEELMYPGDDSLGASDWNIYNCRCTTRNICVGFRPTLPEELRGSIKVTEE